MNVASDIKHAASIGPVGASQRSLAILNALRYAKQPMALPALADATGLDPSTVHRALKTLVEFGYAVRLPTKTYMIGPSMLTPVGFDHPLIGLRHESHAHLVDLASETQMTATLLIILGEQRVALDIVLGRDRITPYFSPKVSSPVHSTASGRLLLLSAPQQRWSALLGPEPYERFTENTTITFNDLTARLEAGRSDGFQWTRDETVVGVTGLGAPLRTEGNRIIGGLSLYGNSRWVDEKPLRDAGARLAQAARMLNQTSASLRALSTIFES
jgi:DNA-binding IclR family transcriptional regulator